MITLSISCLRSRSRKNDENLSRYIPHSRRDEKMFVLRVHVSLHFYLEMYVMWRVCLLSVFIHSHSHCHSRIQSQALVFSGYSSKIWETKPQFSCFLLECYSLVWRSCHRNIHFLFSLFRVSTACECEWVWACSSFCILCFNVCLLEIPPIFLDHHHHQSINHRHYHRW